MNILIENPPKPFRIGKRPPAPKNRATIEDSRGGGCSVSCLRGGNRKRRFLLLCAARYLTQAAAARPISPCGGDPSGHVNAGASPPADQPAGTRRTPSVALSLSRSRPRRWCRPVGRRGDGRGDGRGVGLVIRARGVAGLVTSRARAIARHACHTQAVRMSPVVA